MRMTEEIKFRAPDGTTAALRKLARRMAKPRLRKPSVGDVVREAIDEKIQRMEKVQAA